MAMATLSFSSLSSSSRSTCLSSGRPKACGKSPRRHSFEDSVGLCPQSQSPVLFHNERSCLSSALTERVRMKGRSRRGLVTCWAHFTMMPIGVPRVRIRTPGEGGWQWVDLWNALYRERIIFLTEWIDEALGNQILSTMLYLDSIDYSQGLSLYINGEGGDITPCMSIFDTMESLRSPVATMCLGQAYNLSGFLLAAGEKGQRWAFPLSRIALYPIAGAARGRADDIQNEANELLRIRDYLFQKLAVKTGQPVEKIKEDLDIPKRFTSQQAIEYGIIDQIARPRRIKVDSSEKKNANKMTDLG
uniref:ATP-dependent Clp protease proteolytic subunit n=1 Tax=Wollemia nobilis TaxID=56998 RepID=A0A0C9RH83_9CONI